MVFLEQEAITEDMKSILSSTFSTKSDKLPSDLQIRSTVAVSTNDYLVDSFHVISTTTIFRGAYVPKSFCILTEELMLNIRELFENLGITKVIELSCGSGWFSYWLRKYGVSVQDCVDDMSWGGNKRIDYQPWVNRKDSILCVKHNPEVELFILSWPYMDSVAYDIWSALKPNQYLLYIGEGFGGCTADDDFFKVVEGHEVDIDFDLLSFYGIRDSLTLYKKK